MTTINREELQKALEVVKPGLASRELIKQTTSFAFINNKVVTYNDEISISHPIDGLGIEGAVQAEKLYAFLSKIKKSEIEMSVSASEIQFKAGRTRAGLALQSEIRLPLEELGEISNWKPLPKDFMTALEFTRWTCSHDMSKPVLTCVHVSQKGYVESSDNHRLTKYTVGRLPISAFLIPATSVQELVQYKPTYIAQGVGWVHFKTSAGTVFSCRIFDDKYPDTQQLLAVEGTSLKLPKTIAEVLERASVFNEVDHKLDEEVSLTLEKNKLIIYAHSEIGWIEEVARIKYDGVRLVLTTNPFFLREVVSKTQSCVLGAHSMKFTGENWEHVIALTSIRDDVSTQDDVPF